MLQANPTLFILPHKQDCSVLNKGDAQMVSKAAGQRLLTHVQLASEASGALVEKITSYCC